MDPVSIILTLIGKLTPLAVEAAAAAQAGDAARHAQAVQALNTALADAQADVAQLDADHAVIMDAARAKIAARFPAATPLLQAPATAD